MGGGSEYQFVAWTRSGLGALLDGAAKAATLDLGSAGQVPAQLAAYGPDDVQGLDPRAIVRTVPRDGTHDFEPNLLAAVELVHPGLPWWLSGPQDASGRVSPWIALVVVERGAGVTLSGGQLEICLRGEHWLAASARPGPHILLLSRATLHPLREPRRGLVRRSHDSCPTGGSSSSKGAVARRCACRSR